MTSSTGFAKQITKKMLFLERGLGHDRVAHIIEQGLSEKPTDEEVAEAIECAQWGLLDDASPERLSARDVGRWRSARADVCGDEMERGGHHQRTGFHHQPQSRVAVCEGPASLLGRWRRYSRPNIAAVSSSKAFVIYPQADTDSDLER